MKRTQYRQGDVMIERIQSLPKKLEAIKRDNGRIILAYGEVTFHAHGIAESHVEHFTAPSEAANPGLAPATYLEVKEAMAALTHEEHAAIQLPPGFYRVIRQREYSPAALRNVAD